MSSITNIYANIFIGRTDEQEKFREALRQVPAKPSPLAFGKEKPLGSPFVFLLSGEGGMGKTMLARRLDDIAVNEAEFRDHFAVAWLDWKARQAQDARLKETNFEPVILFENIYTGLQAWPLRAKFGDYEKAIRALAKMEAQVRRVLAQSRNESEQRVRLSKLGDKTFRWLAATAITTTATTVTGGKLSIPKESVAELANAGIDLAIHSIKELRGSVRALVLKVAGSNERFDLYVSPENALMRHLAKGIRDISSSQPVVIILDNYHLVDRTDLWLHNVILQSGPRVIWVIATRKDLAQVEAGYEEGRLPTKYLCICRLSRFNEKELESYFGEYARARGDTAFLLNPDEVETVMKYTLGVPLAVRQAAILCVDDKVPVAQGEFVSDVVNRQLGDPSPTDRRQLYALAIVRKPDQPILAAMFQTDSLEQALTDLHSRHACVSVMGMCLQKDIAHFVRKHLLCNSVLRSEPEVRKLNNDAIAHLTARQSAHEKRINDLNSCPKDSQWQETLLSLVHHSFWLGEEEGWCVCLPAFVLGVNQNREFASELVQVAAGFEDALPFTPEGKARLSKMRKILEKRRLLPNVLLNILEGSAGYGEAHAGFQLLWIQVAAHQLGKIPTERWPNLRASYPHLMNLLGKESANLSATGAFLLETSGTEKITRVEQLTRETVKTKAVFEQIIQKYPDLVPIHHTLGNLQRSLGLYAEATKTFQKALDRNPDDATSHIDLGRVYYDMGRYIDAKTHFQKAKELDPQSAESHLGIGDILTATGQYEEALDAYAQARAVEPENYVVHCGFGNIYHRSNELEQARTGYERALQCNSQSADAHCGLGNVRFALGNLGDALDSYQHALRFSTNLIAQGIISARAAACCQKLGIEENYRSYAELVSAALSGTRVGDYDRARVEAILGNTDAALERLQAALTSVPEWRLRARHDPDLAELKKDSRFNTLVGE